MSRHLTETDRDAIWESINFWDDEADDLYPVVERLITQARASALREAAESFKEHHDWAYPYLHDCYVWIRDRADQEEVS